jgi:hypothetical protein
MRKEKWQLARWSTALRNGIHCVATFIVRFKSVAPYALIELILPGGTVMALLLWLYRQRRNESELGLKASVGQPR